MRFENVIISPSCARWAPRWNNIWNRLFLLIKLTQYWRGQITNFEGVKTLFWRFFHLRKCVHPFGTLYLGLLIFVLPPLPLFVQALQHILSLGCHHPEKVLFLWTSSRTLPLTWSLHIWFPKTVEFPPSRKLFVYTGLFLWDGNPQSALNFYRPILIPIAPREYVESLHQNRTSALLYGHNHPHSHPCFHPRPLLIFILILILVLILTL